MIQQLERVPVIQDQFTVAVHGRLILRLSLHNQTTESLLVRPTLGEWIIEGDRTLIIPHDLTPAYVYLSPGGKAEQAIVLEIPGSLQLGQQIKSWLRFPGLQENATLLDLQLVAPGGALGASPGVSSGSTITEYPLAISFASPVDNASPLTLSPDPTIVGIHGLISGLMDLDKIPCRWLVVELCLLLAQNGETQAKTTWGSQLLGELRQAPWFQRGLLTLNQAQVEAWFVQSFALAETLLPTEEKRLLVLWERWLLGLVQTDLEIGTSSQMTKTPALFHKEWSDVCWDTWFAYFLLGLANLSPEIETLCRQKGAVTTIPAFQSASDTLQTTLPGLDTLPARWLVVELLLKLAQIGYAHQQTAAGQVFLQQLSATRLFKNGVLALAAAQAPRWIQVTQATASAFAANLGGQVGAQGLLALGAQWLQSLAMESSGEIFSYLPPSAPHLSINQGTLHQASLNQTALLAELGMDAAAWFGVLILGLGQRSPRIRAVLETTVRQTQATIATQFPSASDRPISPVQDIFQEAQSLQR